MPDADTFGLFLAAAFVVSITPGPGIFYVLTRSLKGGRSEGTVSSFGNAVGGLMHVVAAALGLSAVLMTSATAFTVVKFLGAAYLVYLGIRVLLSYDTTHALEIAQPSKKRGAFFQGVISEVLNPKAALFFLAFLPQFVDPYGPIVTQILLLGLTSVLFNTIADLVVAYFAGPIGTRLSESVSLRRGQRLLSGYAFIALGAYMAVADNKR